jgi:hypothetical protein
MTKGTSEIHKRGSRGESVRLKSTRVEGTASESAGSEILSRPCILMRLAIKRLCMIRSDQQRLRTTTNDHIGCDRSKTITAAASVPTSKAIRRSLIITFNDQIKSF